jgi:hypothetical protein
MSIVIFINGAMIWHPGVPCHGTRIACALRIETEVKRANILHSNSDMQMNFPQISAIPAKMASNSRPSSPDKLPFEMSAGQVELKTRAMGLRTHASRDLVRNPTDSRSGSRVNELTLRRPSLLTVQ